METSHGARVDPQGYAKTLEQMEEILDAGQASFDGAYLKRNVIAPGLGLMSRIRTERMWTTLAGAMGADPDGLGQSLSKNYFHKKLKSLRGLSRLEHWEKQGFAIQIDGIWLIHVLALPETVTDGLQDSTTPVPAPPERGRSGITEADIEALFSEK